MASSVDIAPSVGHAPLTTQLGTGASPGYDMIDLRRLNQAGVREGVHDPTGWKVSEHTPNGLSVDVLSAVGLATVQGDSLVQQGMYVVPPHASTPINLTIGTPHASLPRLDQIFLHVYDETHDGSGLNKASLEVVAGTATGGATLDNRTGAAAAPSSALLLCDILVRASATTVVNSDLRDRRKWANGANAWNNATSNVPIGGAQAWGPKLRVECSGAPLRLALDFLLTYGSNSAGVFAAIFLMDGQPYLGGSLGATWDINDNQSPASSTRRYHYEVALTPTPGSHLFQLYATCNAGAPATILATANAPCFFHAWEDVQPSANNGTT